MRRRFQVSLLNVLRLYFLVRRVAPGLRFSHSFPASPGEVARMRRVFAAWVDGVSLEPARRRDVVLAVAEAAANAAEHAYRFDGTGIVHV